MPLVVLSEKVQPEVLEQWRKAKDESEAQTGNQFVELILEKLLNPKVRTVEIVKPTPEQAAEVQNLINEIGRLKTEITLKDDQFLALEETLKDLGEKVAASNQQPAASNQVILNLSPVVLEVARREAEAAVKRTRQQFTIEDVFTQCFWAGINEGAAYPWRVWSSSEINDVKKKFAAAQPVNHE